MEKRTSIFLVLSLGGILLLLFLSQYLEPDLKNLENLSLQSGKIRVEAKISAILNPNPEFYILKLEASKKEITAIINTNQNIKDLTNKTCMFTGKIIEYKDSFELSVDQISSCIS